MRERIRVIYNPTAGKEAFKQHLADVLAILEEEGGLEASCHATRGAGDATKAAIAAAQEGFSYVVACGGDGTVHEVVNGLAQCDQHKRPVLGIIPAGTTNDLARALGIPFQIEHAAKIVARRRTMPLDLGQIGLDHYFVNIAACGRLAEITYDVPSKLKTVLGQLAYYMKSLERLPGLRPIHLHVQAGDVSYEGKAMLCLITNSRSVGGFEHIAPQALVYDGLLDVMIVKPTNLGDMIRLVSAALRGEHTRDERVLYFHSSEIMLSSEDEVDLNIDGEYGGKLPQKVRVMPQHLSVIVKQ
ncbi:YegS/Rv2252/BmrU family lipid kinase [Sulfoacidibacillus thermotolerans]|uniref:Lipid kinase n=1 Tax=Sulfoacidibacillus thermotolerans TaxID=1765684 RepID=A0A2U3D7I9_SULT2|nr:YegS/Rv2252/BmrU family lipid kinase [Sulfoacidibacillus thermotolerans]PWI57260.1 lipid kinase [Sulfoacidibacillus thermotolerans]